MLARCRRSGNIATSPPTRHHVAEGQQRGAVSNDSTRRWPRVIGFSFHAMTVGCSMAPNRGDCAGSARGSWHTLSSGANSMTTSVFLALQFVTSLSRICLSRAVQITAIEHRPSGGHLEGWLLVDHHREVWALEVYRAQVYTCNHHESNPQGESLHEEMQRRTSSRPFHLLDLFLDALRELVNGAFVL